MKMLTTSWQSTRLTILAVLCMTTWFGFRPTSAQVILGDWQISRSTYYDGIDAGNCGFETIPSSSFPYRFIAAANTALYAGSAACGLCYEVQCTGSDYLANACTNQSVIVQVTDQCPCDGNEGYCCGDIPHLDLSVEAFGRISQMAAGVIHTKIRPVACPVPGPLQVKIKDGSNAWWMGLLATNVGGTGAVSNIEVYSGGSWISAQRQTYNYWLVTSGSGMGFPLTVRVSQGNSTVMGSLTSMSPGASFPLSSNFAPLLCTH